MSIPNGRDENPILRAENHLPELVNRAQFGGVKTMSASASKNLNHLPSRSARRKAVPQF